MTAPLYAVSIDGIALSAATAKTIFELATPSTTGAVIVDWSVTFDGTTATNTPVKVEFGRFSAAVTTATTVTPSKVNYACNAIASQSTTKHTCTSEGAGTASDVLIYRVPPTSGLILQDPLDYQWHIPASSFFRIRVTAAQTVNISFTARWSE